jgi:uncharacterized membrane protein
MGKPWFRVKRFGYGAGLPCSWEGWAVVTVFLAVVIGGGVLSAVSADAHVAVILTATAIVTLIAWRKSDGPWKWRNGE